VTSGGGFSDYYSTPDYQEEAVVDYFKNLTFVPYPGYNINGRGYPDVSLLGYNYTIVVDGMDTFVSGTSASAPVFAAMISLLNSNRKASNISSSYFGFLNPLLYEVIALDAKEFIFDPYKPGDVISGDNKCTAEGLVCCAQGFSAGVGWDPVTGLGSLNFTHFNDYLINFKADPSRHTELPTAAPTQHPNPISSPTHSPVADIKGYFAYVAVYEDDQCSGQPHHVTSFKTEICYSLASGIYAQFSCESNPGAAVNNSNIFTEADAFYAQAALYSDSNCEFDILSKSFNFGCSKSLMLNSDTYISSQVLCTNATSYNTALPLDTTEGKTYTLLEGFLGDTCNNNNCQQSNDNIVMASGFQQNYCFNEILFSYTLDYTLSRHLPPGTIVTSFEFTTTKKNQEILTVYPNAECKGVGIPISLYTTCTGLAVVLDDYNYNEKVITEWIWTSYPYNNIDCDSKNRLSAGIIALIVILVVSAAAATGFFIYRKVLFNRQMAVLYELSALSQSINPPVQTTVVRINTPTTNVISTHDTVPNPIITTATPVNRSLVLTPVSNSPVARY